MLHRRPQRHCTVSVYDSDGMGCGPCCSLLPCFEHHREEGPMKSLPDAARDFEHAYIKRALRKSDGNLTKTANALGVSRRTLTEKIASHDLHEFAATLRTKAGISGPR